MKSDKNNYFLTKDLSLGALLYAAGVELVRVDRQGKLCWFVFSNRETCEKLQRQFFAKSAQVNAKEYADAIRTLKDLVFAQD